MVRESHPVFTIASSNVVREFTGAYLPRIRQRATIVLHLIDTTVLVITDTMKEDKRNVTKCQAYLVNCSIMIIK